MKLGVIFTIFFVVVLVFGGGFGCSSKEKAESKKLVEQRFATAEDLTRIREYFTGREAVGDRVYLRTNPAEREGYYWIVPARELDGDPRMAMLTIQLPGSPAWVTYELPIAENEHSRSVFWVGVTGEDWPGKRFRPIAWRLSFQSADGTTFYARESFLWTPETTIVSANENANEE